MIFYTDFEALKEGDTALLVCKQLEQKCPHPHGFMSHNDEVRGVIEALKNAVKSLQAELRK